MQHATHPTPQTRGNAAAVGLLAILAAVVVLAVVSTIYPAPMGGTALLALALGVLGLVLGAHVEAVRP